MGNVVEKCLSSDKQNANKDIVFGEYPDNKIRQSPLKNRKPNTTRFKKKMSQPFNSRIKQSPKIATIQITPSGNKVKGFLSGNTIDEGTIEYANGDIFTGAVWEGKAHGNGQMRYKNGDYYYGRFANDLREGDGVLTHANGQIYRGSFKKDLYDGEGYFKFYNGDVYKGGYSHLLLFISVTEKECTKTGSSMDMEKCI